MKIFWKPLKNFFINGDRVRESRGELIQVRNTATNRIVEGIVTKQGTVQVKM